MFLFKLCILYVMIFCIHTAISAEEDKASSKHNQKVAENRLTSQIFALIEHYKQADPVGIPNAPIPDPFPVPDVKKSFGMATLSMMKTKAFGFSKFRLRKIKMDLQALKVQAEIQLDVMVVKGNYTLSAIFQKGEGPFTILLKNVVAKGNASVGVERDGKIRTQDIAMDLAFSNMTMNFENLGFLGSVFQSIVNGAPNLVFDSMKPFLLQEAYQKLRTEIDGNIDKVAADYRLPNSISPLDMAIAEARKKLRSAGFDPYRLQNYNHTVGLIAMKLSNTWITGASSFYRVGDIILGLDNNTMTIELQVGTQRIMGSSQWEVSAGKGMITRVGHFQFTVEHIKATFMISQSLDVRNRPKINDIQIELGNIQVRSDGAGTLDYLVEFIVNVVPNLLRYQLMDALENPAKIYIQKELDKVNVEKIIKEKLPEFEKMGFDFKV